MRKFTIIITEWEEHREEADTYKRLFFPVYCESREDVDYLAERLFPHISYTKNMAINVIAHWFKQGERYEDYWK